MPDVWVSVTALVVVGPAEAIVEVGGVSPALLLVSDL